jgi:hypothetical protein
MKGRTPFDTRVGTGGPLTLSNYPVNFVANYIETNYFENFVVNYKRIEVVHDKFPPKLFVNSLQANLSGCPEAK